MKKHLALTAGVALAFMTAPMLAYSGNRPAGGVPQVLSGVLQTVEDINGKIDGLDSDDDNPLLSDILSEIQSLHGDVNGLGGATINDAQQAEGLLLDPVEGTTHDVVSVTGSGTFVAARMTKQGGSSNITTVELVIDGKTIVGRTYAALDNWGMTQNNPFGVVLLHGNGVDAVTIGFPQPIKFNESLVLRTNVGESGIVQMIGTVIYGQ